MIAGPPLIIHSWDRAIAHIDGDAFFASCEQAINPSLRGKPVVTGYERGVAVAVSYEAKRMGVKRGMAVYEIRKRYPDCVIVSSHYYLYGLFSRKMFSIMRRYSPTVEEYSIDEGFVDLTGLQRPMRLTYKQIAEKMKKDIESSLGIGVSVGVSLTKSLAKLASDFEKPSGCTIVPGTRVYQMLEKIDLEDIWGIGHNTANYLRKFGLRSALDFARKSEEFVKSKLNKSGWEIWCELRGHAVYEVNPKEKSSYRSISKTHTFFSPSSQKDYVYAQLVNNLERACGKARKYGLSARGMVLFLKTQSFSYNWCKVKLSSPSHNVLELVEIVRGHFPAIWKERVSYRATGIALTDLTASKTVQYSLFDDTLRIEKVEKAANATYMVNERMGRGSIFLGSVIPIKRERVKHKMKHNQIMGRESV